MDWILVIRSTSDGADEDAEAALLQDVDVVVVGVAHGPTAVVSSGFLALLRVHVLAVAVGPVHVGIWVWDL
jgi:hypothetical protein